MQQSPKKAGRKNLVFQSLNDVVVGTAILDNREGGARAYGGSPGQDYTDGHSLDVEPDNYSGLVPNRAYIGKLVTYGSGNDFGAGTALASAEAYVVSIGDMDSYITPRADVVPWAQYGITINVGNLRMSGAAGSGQQIQVFYAARLNVGEGDISCDVVYSDAAILVQSVNADAQPEVRFKRLKLRNRAPRGIGIENRDGLVDIGEYNPSTDGLALFNNGISSVEGFSARILIGTLRAKNIGRPDYEGWSVEHRQQGAQLPILRIGVIDVADTRPSKNNYIVAPRSGQVGVNIGQVVRADTATGYPVGLFSGYYQTGIDRFVSIGTPEGVIAAHIGATCVNLTGSAGTVFYVKESNTGSTGWVAK